jgi:hypothetical protein
LATSAGSGAKRRGGFGSSHSRSSSFGATGLRSTSVGISTYTLPGGLPSPAAVA